LDELPYYYDSPLFGRRGPYKTEADARKDAEAELGYYKWISEHEIGLASAVMFGGIMYMSLKHPDKMAPVLQSLTSLISESVKGTGEIIKGIGEVVPG